MAEKQVNKESTLPEPPKFSPDNVPAPPKFEPDLPIPDDTLKNMDVPSPTDNLDPGTLPPPPEDPF